jgi:predicted rRNA methylase
MTVYGKRPLREILHNRPDKIRRLYLQEKFGDAYLLDLIAKKAVKAEYQSKEFLNRLTKNAPHQGIAAELPEYPRLDLNDLLAEKLRRILILDELTDPQNLGALIRSCDCFGCSQVLIPASNSAGITPAVVKVSCGATEYVKVYVTSSIYKAALALKKAGVTLIGLSHLAQIDINDCRPPAEFALVLGSEGKGIRKLVVGQCDQLVRIGMVGHIESLNVSVAGAIGLEKLFKKK